MKFKEIYPGVFARPYQNELLQEVMIIESNVVNPSRQRVANALVKAANSGLVGMVEAEIQKCTLDVQMRIAGEEPDMMEALTNRYPEFDDTEICIRYGIIPTDPALIGTIADYKGLMIPTESREGKCYLLESYTMILPVSSRDEMIKSICTMDWVIKDNLTLVNMGFDWELRLKTDLSGIKEHNLKALIRSHVYYGENFRFSRENCWRPSYDGYPEALLLEAVQFADRAYKTSPEQVITDACMDALRVFVDLAGNDYVPPSETHYVN